MTPEQTADHLEIAQVVQRYFRSMDTYDFDLLDDVFVPGAVMRYEALDGIETTYPAMVEQFRQFNRHFSFMQHAGNQLLIELDGDSARASSTLRALHVQTTHEGDENEWVVYGLYRDRLVRTPAGWRIAERHFKSARTVGELLPFERVKSYDAPPWL